MNNVHVKRVVARSQPNNYLTKVAVNRSRYTIPGVFVAVVIFVAVGNYFDLLFTD